MDATVIRVDEPRELLAYIPYGLGFRPAESLVVMSLRNGRRVGLVARVDLADLAAPITGTSLARSLARHLDSDGASHVVVVVYTAQDRADVRNGRGVAGAATAVLRSQIPPAKLADIWLVGPRGYAALDCVDTGCCPVEGRPLVDLESTQVGAHMVMAGAAVVADRGSLAVRGRASVPARRSALRAAADERDRRRRMRPAGEKSGDTRPAAEWSRRALARWEDLLGRVEGSAALPPAALGRVLVALEDVHVRDEMILRLVAASAPRKEAAPEDPDGEGDEDCGATTAALHAVEMPGAAEMPGAVMMPGAPPPIREQVLRARTVLEAVVAHAPTVRSAPPLAVLAWLSWWEGDGARAAVLAEQCLGVDPQHRLGRLLAAVLDHGIAPGWVRGSARGQGADLGEDGHEPTARPSAERRW